MTKHKFNKNGNKGNFNRIKGADSASAGRYRNHSPRPRVEKNYNDYAPWKMDTSYELMSWFKRQAETRPYDGESADALIKRFKGKCEKAGILKEVRKREYHKTDGQLRREAQLKAEKHARKERAKAERWDKNKD